MNDLRLRPGANDRHNAGWAVAAATAIGLLSTPAQAANQAFENFFIAACTGATGALATQCNTNIPGALLSGDSESSLNPSQVSSGNNLSITRAKAVTSEAQERLETSRAKQAGRYYGLNAGDEAGFGALSMYLNLKGEKFDRDRLLDVDQEKGFDGWTAGFQLGADYRLSDALVVGALLGIDHSELKFDADTAGGGFNPGDNEGGTRSDNFFLNVYSSYSVTDNFYVDGTIGAGYTDYTFDRNVILQNTARAFAVDVAATGETHGFEYSLSAGAGYDFYKGALSIGPYVRVNYARSHIQGFTEDDRNGTGMNMFVGDAMAQSTTSVVGVQASYAISQDWGVILPQFRFEVEHEFEDDPRFVTSSMAQSNANATFATSSDAPDRNYYNLGVGLLMILPNGWMPFLDAEMLLGYKDFDRQRYTAGLRAEF